MTTNINEQAVGQQLEEAATRALEGLKALDQLCRSIAAANDDHPTSELARIKGEAASIIEHGNQLRDS